MNPYPDARLSRCPVCEGKTGQRKLPLVIHVEPGQLVALNYTCRYCKHCDLLAAHKHEIEHLLSGVFLELDPGAIGNDYLVLGTVEKRVWRQNMQRRTAPAEFLKDLVQFRTVYQELTRRCVGWFPAGRTPPMEKPPPSREWTRS